MTRRRPPSSVAVTAASGSVVRTIETGGTRDRQTSSSRDTPTRDTSGPRHHISPRTPTRDVDVSKPREPCTPSVWVFDSSSHPASGPPVQDNLVACVSAAELPLPCSVQGPSHHTHRVTETWRSSHHLYHYTTRRNSLRPPRHIEYHRDGQFRGPPHLDADVSRPRAAPPAPGEAPLDRADG